MKNTYFVGFSVLILGMLSVSSVTALASIDNPEANTTGKVKFQIDDSTGPEVIDPTDPDGGNIIDPSVPNPNEEEGTIGDGNKSFNINWISNFKFDVVNIAGKEMKAYAKPTTLHMQTTTEPVTPVLKENLPNFIQVTDNRGTNTGWNVKATATEFVGTDEAGVGDYDLKGAKILLTNPQLFATSANLDLSPITHATSLDLLENPGSANMILEAEPNKGQGTWSMAWSPAKLGNKYEFVYNNSETDKGVQLLVPATAMPKDKVTYTSTITWVLSDTPNK